MVFALGPGTRLQDAHALLHALEGLSQSLTTCQASRQQAEGYREPQLSSCSDSGRGATGVSFWLSRNFYAVRVLLFVLCP